MRATLVSEYRKLVTTRSWWLLLLLMSAYMGFTAAVIGFTVTQTASLGEIDGAANPFPATAGTAIAVYTIAVSAGYVFPVLVGAMSVTSEFRHKTITPTFLGEPNRDRVLSAKMLAAVPVGLLYGLAGTLAGLVAGAGALAVFGHDTFLGDADVQTALARSVLALTIWTVVGVALGAAIPHQVVVIVIVLAFTQFVEPLLRGLLTAVADGRFADVARFMPGAAGEAITGRSFYSAAGLGDLLPWWQGLLVLLAYAVVLAGIGRVTTFRRDIT